ncbi:MAG: IclR family transcriptional regulator [Micrococcales bacterium 73-13]|nr:MAG: IclR family transcriptional regulator [Micrococcales bacterium 73-13]
MANSGSGDSMVERVVRILGAFDRGHTDLSPSEVARRAGLPMSSAHRIVGDLLRTGLLERDLEGRVRIGMRLWELTTRGSRALALRQAALPAMERAQAEIGEHVQLGVLDQDEVLVIEQLSAPDAVSNVTTVAGRLPLHASSSGLVLLAFGRQTLRNRILARPLPPVGPSTITDAAALGRRLDAVRRDGYAILAGSIESVATGISVPVADRAGTTVAVLSAVVPTGWPRERETLDALRRTAQTVSEAIADYGILTH